MLYLKVTLCASPLLRDYVRKKILSELKKQILKGNLMLQPKKVDFNVLYYFQT